MKDIVVHTSVAFVGLLESLVLFGQDTSRQPACCALEEGNLLIIDACVDKENKHTKDCCDVGTESKDDNIAVNDGGDDGLGVSFGDLAGCLTDVQL